VILCSTFEFLFKFQNRIFLEFLFDFQVVRTSNRSKFEGPLYRFCIVEWWLMYKTFNLNEFGRKLSWRFYNMHPIGLRNMLGI
jgi:hypothetical protein